MSKTRKQESPFRKILCELMEQRGLSVRKAGNIAGVAASTVANWRNGAAPIDHFALRRLADYLGVTLGYLLTGTPDSIMHDKVNEPTQDDGRVVFEGYARIVIHPRPETIE